MQDNTCFFFLRVLILKTDEKWRKKPTTINSNYIVVENQKYIKKNTTHK